MSSTGRNRTRALADQLVAKHPILFDEHGFEFVFEATWGRYESEPVVGLSNGRLQMLVDEDINPPYLSYVGAQFIGNSGLAVEDERYMAKYWLPTPLVLAYLDQSYPPLDWRRANGRLFAMQTWEHLTARLSEIEPLFANEGAMRRWMPDYLRTLQSLNIPLHSSQRDWLKESDAG